MKEIDKTIYRDAFNQYTRAFIKAAWNGSEFYPPLELKVCYESFSNKKWKLTSLPGSAYSGWLDILMHEQDSRCCYCMRRLSNSEVSVEHLIPESFTNLDKDDEFAFYYEMVPGLSELVVDSGQIGRSLAANPSDIDTVSGMPHLIAHSNLFAACNCHYGCSCNNHRGNNRILPMMLMSGVDSWVKYEINGKISILHDDIQLVSDTLKHLDLNSKTLVIIRHLWYLFTKQNIQPNVNKRYTFPEKDNLIRTALGLDVTEVIPEQYRCFLKTDVTDYYWNLLLAYDWFGRYY